MRTKLFTLCGGALVVLSACTDGPARPTGPPRIDATMATASAAQERLLRASTGRAIADRFIVVLESGENPTAVSAAVNVHPTHVYTAALNGFAAKLTPAQLERLLVTKGVRYVAPDEALPRRREPREEVGSETLQPGAPWNIDRLDTWYNYPWIDGQYRYVTTGTGVNVYVIGSGINTGHVEFGGRAKAGSSGFDAIGDGRNGQDCNGAGTHMASLVGGATFGVAKAVKLFSVRVWPCDYANGQLSQVLAGIDWVTNKHVKPAVALLDLNISALNQPTDDAVRQSIAWGVTYVVPAGEKDGNACLTSPANVREAITVSASGYPEAGGTMYPMPQANQGPCVDVFAPGVSLLGAWIGSNTATATITWEYHSPAHVAGLAAQFVQLNKTAGPGMVQEVISDMASNYMGGLTAGTPDRFAHRPADRITCVGCLDFQPENPGSGPPEYETTTAGWHHGWLQGAAGTNFDLRLLRYNSLTLAWEQVGKKATSSSKEYLVAYGPAGTYKWEIKATAGTGDYDLFMIRPPYIIH